MLFEDRLMELEINCPCGRTQKDSVKISNPELVFEGWIEKQKVKEAIKCFLTDWKADDITCECESCYNTKLSLIERDKLLKELGLDK